MKQLLLVALSLVAAAPGAASACTLVYDPRPRDVQQDEAARLTFPASVALVEVVAVEGSSSRRPGVVRVIRSYKGPFRPGRLISLYSMDSAMCGAGDFKRGSRGLIQIARLNGRKYFQGFLPADYLARLDRLGLRVPAVRPPSR